MTNAAPIPRAHIEELAERVSAVANAIQSGNANLASREARIACRIASRLLDREDAESPRRKVSR